MEFEHSSKSFKAVRGTKDLRNGDRSETLPRDISLVDTKVE